VLRGSLFNYDASKLLSSYRNGNPPVNRIGLIGLRCARTP